MKKILLTLLSLCLTVMLAGCINITITTDNVKEEKNEWGVTLEIKEQTRDYITTVIKYDGTEVTGELGCGDDFTLQILDKDTNEWKNVEADESLLAFNDIEHIIREEQDVEITHVLEAFKMKNGHYRLGKRIQLLKAPGDYEVKTLYVEFDEKSYDTIATTSDTMPEDIKEEMPKIFGVEEDVEHNSYSYNVAVTKDSNGSYLVGLSGNPTTGYSWNVVNQESSFRGSVVYVDGDITYLPASQDSNLVGGSGNFFVTITPQDPMEEYDPNEFKQTKITLRYFRPWESQDNYLAQCDITFSLIGENNLTYHIDK